MPLQYGALGTNYSKNQLEPEKVLQLDETPLTGIRKISVGYQHVLALRNDGTVYAWGLGTSGQLGQGNKNNSWLAVPILNEDGSDVIKEVSDIAAGYDFSVIVTKEKLAYGFGSNANYTYGTNDTTTYLLPTKVHYINNVISANGGSDHTIFLKSDGTVWGAGFNTSGQLGDGTKSTRVEVVQATDVEWNGKLKDVVRIETGLHHTIALKKDKTAVGWGYNNYGQLGVTATPQPVPINMAYSDGSIIENITNIGCNQYGTYIETESKETEETEEIEVIGAGLNTSGELGINSKTTVKVFNVIKDTDGVSYLGNVASLGQAWLTHYGYAMDDGKVKITGIGTSGQHGNGWISNSIAPTEIEGGELSAEKMYEINVGEKILPKVTVVPNFNLNLPKDEDFIPGTLRYESLDEEIATVAEDGTITGVSTGSTGIMVYDDDKELEGIIYVIVGKRDFKNIEKIVSGLEHTALLKSDGTVWTWGNNQYGELGNGEIANKICQEPTQVLGINGEGYLTDVVDIAAGDCFNVALLKSGEVVAWGWNAPGTLGNIRGDTPFPVYVRKPNGDILKGAVSVAAGSQNGAAVMADGSVWAWGKNNVGQLSQGHTTEVNYAVTAWLGDYPLRGVKKVDIGADFMTALMNDGTVYSWGYNNAGQLCNGTRTNSAQPVQAKWNSSTIVEDVIDIASGNNFVLALFSDNTVNAWGRNNVGQLGYGSASTTITNGNGSKVYANVVAFPEETKITQISVLQQTGFALIEKPDGTNEVYGWGLNTSGEIGTNNNTNQYRPALVYRAYGEAFNDKIKKIQAPSMYASTMNYIREDGSILLNGKVDNGQLTYRPALDSFYTTVEDVHVSTMEITDRISYIKKGQSKKLNINVLENLNAFAKAPDIGNLTWESTNTDVATVDQNGNVVAIKTGETVIIAKEDKHGYKAQARVYVTSDEKNTITAPQVVQGTNFTAVLRADGTVWMSGKNNVGQLGRDDISYSGELLQVKTDENTYLTNVTRISAGANHMLAVTNDGSVYAWGNGANGKLGNGDTNHRWFAEKVLDETGEDYFKNAIDVSAGTLHSLILTKDGTVYGMGSGANYRLGVNSTGNFTLPVEMVYSYNTVEIAAGAIHSVVLKADGMTYSVGGNANGQAGQDMTADVGTLWNMLNSDDEQWGRRKDIISIRAGGNHTVALTKTGEVYACGLNTSGQLSTGNTTQSKHLIPMTIYNEAGELVNLDGVKSIGVGNASTFAVLKTGEVYACGLNSSGQLGLNKNDNPITVMEKVLDETGEDTLKDIDYAVVGEGATLNSGFITNDGKVWLVGRNPNGELADDKFFDTWLVVRAGENNLRSKDINIDMMVGDTYNIEVSLDGAFNAYLYEEEIKNLKFETNTPDIINVSETGLITAKTQGYGIIKITDIDHNLEEYMKVSVYPYKGKAVPDISSGINFSVALKADGTVWSWGNGASGKLGNGETSNYAEPVRVLMPDGKTPVTNAKQITVRI